MDNGMIVNSIKNLCKNNNITVSQLEKEIGLSQGLVSKWMNTTPSLDKAVDIADYFHVSLDEVVGRNQNLDDEFITKLYNQTNNGLITWQLVTEDIKDEYPQIKLFDVVEDEHQLYDEENYNQKHYTTKYNNGYIIIYAFYQYGNLLKPKILKLFIQPTIESYLIEQNYYQKTLLSLWIKILNSLGNEAPDEVKAEEFKNSFINDKMKIPFDSYTNEQLLQITKNMIEMEPNLPKVFETINNQEFLNFIQTLESPKIQEGLKIAQKLKPYATHILQSHEIGHIATNENNH